MQLVHKQFQDANFHDRFLAPLMMGFSWIEKNLAQVNNKRENVLSYPAITHRWHLRKMFVHQFSCQFRLLGRLSFIKCVLIREQGRITMIPL